jgi:hypothetical protein
MKTKNINSHYLISNFSYDSVRLAATLLGNVDYGQQELTMRQWKSRKSDITP